MKTWSNREVVLLLDFYDLIENLPDRYLNEFIAYYYDELTQVLPEFHDVSFAEFSSLMNGFFYSILDPANVFVEQINYVNMFKNSETKNIIIKFASDYKHKLNIIDCENALLSEVFSSVKVLDDKYEISIKELRKSGYSLMEIGNAIDNLIADYQKKDIEAPEDDLDEEDNVPEVLTEFEQTIGDYLTKKEYFDTITFADKEHPKDVHIPMIYSATMYLIDTQLRMGRQRMTIIMPDRSNMLPLVTSRIIRNEMEDDYDPFDNLRGVLPGQKMKIGKAVIRIESISEDEFQYSCKDLKCTEKRIFGRTWYQFLERVNEGALNKYDYLIDEIRRIEQQAKENSTLQRLMSNKGAVSKTSVMLTTKNSVDECAKDLIVLGVPFTKVISVGEFIQNPIGFACGKNIGKIPNIVICTELPQIVSCIAEESVSEKIDCIYVTQDKVRELLSNRHTFTRLLKSSIPVIVFLAESDYERYNELNKFDFSLFHWKPSTLTDISFSKDKDFYVDTVFQQLVNKTANASKASFDVTLCNGKAISTIHHDLKKVTDACKDYELSFRELIHKLWCAYRLLISDCFSVEIGIGTNPLYDSVVDLYDAWNVIKASYHEDIQNDIENIIDGISVAVLSDSTEKYDCLCETLSNIEENKNVAIIVPDNCAYSEQLQTSLTKLNSDLSLSIKVFKLKEYILGDGHRSLSVYDHVIVLWFDKNDYIKIKNTYSYVNLRYILYSFEERWRSNFRRDFNSSLQHSKTLQTASELHIDEEIKHVPFDEKEYVDQSNKEYEEFDFDSVIGKIYGIGPEPAEHDDDFVPCCLVFSRNFRISLLPTHKVIDVSELIAGNNRIIQRPAQELQHGDCFVVRESNKDIVAEVADGIIGENAEQLRKEVGLWYLCLDRLITEYGFDSIYQKLNDNILCSKQQIRYWSMGETICPDNPRVYETIASLCKSYSDKEITYFCDNYKSLYEKGKRLQRIHMIAGKKINQQLRKKHKEISDIYYSGGRGYLAGIGEVVIIEVDAVYSNQVINRAKLNKLEVI